MYNNGYKTNNNNNNNSNNIQILWKKTISYGFGMDKNVFFVGLFYFMYFMQFIHDKLNSNAVYIVHNTVR